MAAVRAASAPCAAAITSVARWRQNASQPGLSAASSRRGPPGPAARSSWRRLLAAVCPVQVSDVGLGGAERGVQRGGGGGGGQQVTAGALDREGRVGAVVMAEPPGGQ